MGDPKGDLFLLVKQLQSESDTSCFYQKRHHFEGKTRGWVNVLHTQEMLQYNSLDGLSEPQTARDKNRKNQNV